MNRKSNGVVIQLGVAAVLVAALCVAGVAYLAGTSDNHAVGTAIRPTAVGSPRDKAILAYLRDKADDPPSVELASVEAYPILQPLPWPVKGVQHDRSWRFSLFEVVWREKNGFGAKRRSTGYFYFDGDRMVDEFIDPRSPFYDPVEFWFHSPPATKKEQVEIEARNRAAEAELAPIFGPGGVGPTRSPH